MSDKAVLFGINQYEHISNLRGCVNDVLNITTLLVDVFSFSEKNIHVKTDSKVTRNEIQKQWSWLLKGAEPGDRLVFHFSGHGSYTRDQDDDEQDGVDELLCLYDMQWDDPSTYLLDDDLRKMTESIPEGVSVTFLLDACHSGTGTRAIEMPGMESEDISQLPVVDIESSVGRLMARKGPRSRAVSGESLASDTERVLAPRTPADAQRTVFARFVPPPPNIARRYRKAGVRRPLVAMRDSGMNHMLFSGSRADQTSADAYIDGDFHGAFSYYFCEVVRAAGNNVSQQEVIREVKDRLQSEHFSQVPQLEPAHSNGPLFRKDGSPSESASTPHALETGSDPTLAKLLQQLIDLLEHRNATPVTGPLATEARHLAYVHGICRHDPGYSQPWWEALQPHLPQQLASELEVNRHEVLWSEIVSPTRSFIENSGDVESEKERVLSATIREILQDRAEQQIAQSVPEQPPGSRPVQSRMAVDRAVLGIPGLNCVDDFVKYLANDTIRQQVLDAFLEVTQPLLARGALIDIISHSWGTVVAYEGLRQLDGSGLAGSVRTLFTVGSALSIAPVRRGLMFQDGSRPGYVRKWVNLDARGDIVGGSLEAHGFAVDAEYLGLHPAACPMFAGIVSPSCAHSSYFHRDNRAVNDGIFAHFMER